MTTAREFERTMLPIAKLMANGGTPNQVAEAIEETINKAIANEEPKVLIDALRHFLTEAQCAEAIDKELDDWIEDVSKQECETVTDTTAEGIDPILYAVVRDENDGDHSLLVYVTPKKHWNSEHCQADWTPEVAMIALDQAGFSAGEAMEGVIEISEGGLVEASDETEAKLEAFLTDSPIFESDNSFTNYMQECHNAGM